MDLSLDTELRPGEEIRLEHADLEAQLARVPEQKFEFEPSARKRHQDAVRTLSRQIRTKGYSKTDVTYLEAHIARHRIQAGSVVGKAAIVKNSSSLARGFLRSAGWEEFHVAPYVHLLADNPKTLEFLREALGGEYRKKADFKDEYLKTGPIQVPTLSIKYGQQFGWF